MGCVGSCDWSSVTSKLMKVLSAELAASVDELEELVELVEPADPDELDELVAPVELAAFTPAERSVNICATGVIVDIP
jgi:hypothetical protein